MVFLSVIVLRCTKILLKFVFIEEVFCVKSRINTVSKREIFRLSNILV